MFHRVKLDAQDAQTEGNVNEQTERENEAPEATNTIIKSSPDVQKEMEEQKKDVTEQTTNESKSTTTNTDEKDAVTMTQDTQETQTAPSSTSTTEQPSRPEMPATSFGSGATQTAPQSPTFAGAYQNNGYNAAPRTTTNTVSSAPEGGDNSRLVIGRGITMSGEIEACDHLVVEGTVEASLKGACQLDIEESGVFYGAVEIEEATIAGRFEGDVTVNGRLTITSTGQITGSITYRELEIEAGAIIDGRMTPIFSAQNNAQKTEKKAPIVKSAPVKDGQPSAANNDGGLFTEKAVSE